MVIKEIYDYLNELERCEWKNNAIINGIKYNGITIEQGTETYLHILSTMQKKAEQALLSLSSTGHIMELQAIYKRATDLLMEPMDVIDQNAVEALKRDFAPHNRTEAIKMEIDLGQFVVDMHAIQKTYMFKFLSFISGLLPNSETANDKDSVNQKDNALTEIQIDSTGENPASKKEWLTLDEVCKCFNLPKNSVKSKVWRDKNHFPYSQPNGIYGSVSYSRSKVEEWMKAKQDKKC